MLDSKFPNFIITLSGLAPYKRCTENLTTEQQLSSFDQELVLRFFALKNARATFKHDISDFLTDYMEAVADPKKSEQFDYEREEAIFLKTFEVLDRTVGEYAFALVNRAKNAKSAFTASFGIYHFEAVTMGMQSILDRINLDDAAQLEKLKDKLTEIKLDKAFVDMTTGGGKNSPGVLRDRINFVSERLDHAFS